MGLWVRGDTTKAGKSDLSGEQRREIVLMVLRREEPITVLCRRFGISEMTLDRWRDGFVQGGEAALANGKGKSDGQTQRIKELEEDIAERDQVIGEPTIANRVLKKRGPCLS